MISNGCRVLLAIALLAAGGNAARADYISAVEALNPIDYWRFETADRDANDGSNTLQPNAFSANIQDTSGPTSADGFLGFGASNNALTGHNGTSLVAPNITFPNYVPVGPGVAHTLNLWVKPDVTSAALRPMLYGGVADTTSADRFNRIRVQIATTGLLSVDVNFGAASTDANGAKVTFGQWNMITVVVPQAGQLKDLKMYLNGELLTNTSTNTTALQIGFNSSNLLLAPSVGSTGFGVYDEVAFFGTALNGEQVAALYDAAFEPVPEPASASLLAVCMLAVSCLISRKSGSVV